MSQSNIKDKQGALDQWWTDLRKKTKDQKLGLVGKPAGHTAGYKRDRMMQWKGKKCLAHQLGILQGEELQTGKISAVLRDTLAPLFSQDFKFFFPSKYMFVNNDCNQSPFKASHVTKRPSLKHLSGMQVQLLSLWVGKHRILENRSLSLQLNFIFEITNEICQPLCHKSCFFCSDIVIKSFFFFRLDQPVRMLSPECTSQSTDCLYSNGDF